MDKKKYDESQMELMEDVFSFAKERNSGSVKLLNELLDKEGIELNSKKNKSQSSKNGNVNEDIDLPQYTQDSYDVSDDSLYEIDDFEIPHDLIPLPSKGLIYKNIKSKIPVAYLTASDEDLITSPNLYMDGKVIDLLLRKKILDRNINPDYLCKGDRDAIIVWLRASGYGSKMPVVVNDPSTNESFEYDADLSTLKFKEFNLKPNNNGYFEFKLPTTGHVIEFNFLNHKDEMDYEKFLKRTTPKIKKLALTNNYSSISQIVESDNSVDAKTKAKLNSAIEIIKDYAESIDDSIVSYLKSVTYLLEKTIVSIDGSYDKKFIKKYIAMMPALDSMAYRKYLNTNTPGVDFNITVNRPESLGGGSFDTFLEFDNTIFLNIT